MWGGDTGKPMDWKKCWIFTSMGQNRSLNKKKDNLINNGYGGNRSIY